MMRCELPAEEAADIDPGQVQERVLGVRPEHWPAVAARLHEGDEILLSYGGYEITAVVIAIDPGYQTILVIV